MRNKSMTKRIRILIGGMGNAARPMVDLLTTERARLEEMYGLAFQIVGAVDSKGGVITPEGIPSETLAEAKAKGTLANIPGLGIQGLTALEMIEQCSADVYLDGLPPYLPTGEPGTSNIPGIVVNMVSNCWSDAPICASSAPHFSCSVWICSSIKRISVE